MTGEHGELYALVNRGQSACTLRGYPRVTLYDATGTILPFRYVHTSVYLTRAAPRTVVLRPGAAAYVLVAKYRCDRGVINNAVTIRLVAPGSQRSAKTMAVSPGRPVAQSFSYCKGGADDPGQIIGISPIEPTPADAGPFSRQ